MSYGQPSRINFVSMTFFVALAAAIYGGIQYGPAYWRKYKVQEVLDEFANKCRGRRTPDGAVVRSYEEAAARSIEALGIPAPVRVRVTIEDTQVVVAADYTEVIVHPLIKRSSRIEFHPTIERPRFK